MLSVGANSYGHPTAEAMGRIHAHGIETYWTNAGSGLAPDAGLDQVDGNVVINTTGSGYTVNGDQYTAQ